MYVWKLVKAKKAHKCCHCGDGIAPGKLFWGNRRNPHAFCLAHSPLDADVRAARRLLRVRHRDLDPDIARGRRKTVLTPAAIKPPVEDGGALFCPRCDNPLCDTYDPRVVMCHICGYSFVTAEEPAHDSLSIRARGEAEGAEEQRAQRKNLRAENAENFTGRCAQCL